MAKKDEAVEEVVENVEVQEEVEVQPEPVNESVQQEESHKVSTNERSGKQVKLISRLKEDAFIKYFDTEVIVPPQATVTVYANGLTEIPNGIIKVEI